MNENPMTPAPTSTPTPAPFDTSLVRPAWIIIFVGTYFFYWIGLTIFAGALISAISG